MVVAQVGLVRDIHQESSLVNNIELSKFPIGVCQGGVWVLKMELI